LRFAFRLFGGLSIAMFAVGKKRWPQAVRKQRFTGSIAAPMLPRRIGAQRSYT
jgi:hypothetical protein